MSVPFIGYVGNHCASETVPRSGPVIDLDFIEAMAKVQENGGFDRVLTAFNAESPESLLVGQHIASVTRRLGLMIAHRPGFTAPTVARQLGILGAGDDVHGITTFLMRGFDPIADAAAYGSDLLPRVRALVAQRETQAQAA
jgi:hypothetical protein